MTLLEFLEMFHQVYKLIGHGDNRNRSIADLLTELGDAQLRSAADVLLLTNSQRPDLLMTQAITHLQGAYRSFDAAIKKNQKQVFLELHVKCIEAKLSEAKLQKAIGTDVQPMLDTADEHFRYWYGFLKSPLGYGPSTSSGYSSIDRRFYTDHHTGNPSELRKLENAKEKYEATKRNLLEADGSSGLTAGASPDGS